MKIPKHADSVIEDALQAAHGCGMIRDGQIASQVFPLDLDDDDQGITPLEKAYWKAVKRLAVLLDKTGPLYHNGFTYFFTMRNILTICDYYIEDALDAKFVKVED